MFICILKVQKILFSSLVFMNSVYMHLILEIKNNINCLIKMKNQYRQHYHNDYSLK